MIAPPSDVTTLSPRDQLLASYRTYLDISDPEFIDIISAVTLHSLLRDRSMVWIVVVGVSSSGKTLLSWQPFQSLLFHIYNIGQLTPTTFVTGLKTGKDLLPELDGKLVLFKDFTSINVLSNEKAALILAQLRHIYDGDFSAHFGSEKSKASYSVKFDVIACITKDGWHEARMLGARLGERMIPITLHYDRKSVATRAIQNNGKDSDVYAVLQAAMAKFIDAMEPELPKYYQVTISPVMAARINQLVDLTVKLRTVVPIERDGSVDDFYEPDSPGRIVDSLMSIARGLALVYGNSEITTRELDVLRRICYDSVEKKWMLALELMYRNPYSVSELIDLIRLPQATIKRMMNAIWSTGVLNESYENGAPRYVMSPAIKQDILTTRLFEAGPIKDNDKNQYYHDIIWNH